MFCPCTVSWTLVPNTIPAVSCRHFALMYHYPMTADRFASAVSGPKLPSISNRRSEHFDVIIVGAGLSGIGAGYRLQTRCPGRTYAIFEARSVLGGTWDLFRYPGVRSDSDMFTLGYPFRPWKEAKAIADGPSILNYVRDTAREFGIDRHIRYNHRVLSISWASDDGY